MRNTDTKPAFVLAFANDQHRYLRNLPEENRAITAALQEAKRAGLCDLAPPISNATLDEVIAAFSSPEWRDRIAVFHFGGHAGEYQLAFEDRAGGRAVAHAGGFAEFLGRQRGLQLVFLNGCSTGPQVEALIDAGVPAVIATSQAIDDGAARGFAARFYQSLGGGATIDDAFAEAAAGTKTERGGEPRDLHHKDTPPEVADRWPWELHLKPGAELAGQWNLPDAVDDPLFGLPPVPPGDLPDDPFPTGYLDRYTRKDAELFFGRGHDIRKLYSHVTANDEAPIIFLHGQTGVGKSSLLEAGLLPRLEERHGVLYARRKPALRLIGTLRETLGADVDLPLQEAWRALEDSTGLPLLVVLDQVEEAFTQTEPPALEADRRGSEAGAPPSAGDDRRRPPDREPAGGVAEETGEGTAEAAAPQRRDVRANQEIEELFAALAPLFAARDRRPQGKLILGFRKEWLAEVEKSRRANRLPRVEVFLQPLDRRGVIEVVTGPAQSERLRKYGLSVEGVGEEAETSLAQLIADDLTNDPASPIAPTLQVLLRKMWDQAVATAREKGNPEVKRFDVALYQQLKRDGILLGDFLDQQLEALRAWRAEVVASGFALDLLAFHTTTLGTAARRSPAQLQRAYHHREDLTEVVQKTKDLRLLADVRSVATEEGEHTPTILMHDTLAPLVGERFDLSDAPGQRALRILEARAKEWQGDAEGESLDEHDLATVERGESGMRSWRPDERRLVEASRASRAELNRRRRILYLTLGAGIGAGVALGLLRVFTQALITFPFVSGLGPQFFTQFFFGAIAGAGLMVAIVLFDSTELRLAPPEGDLQRASAPKSWLMRQIHLVPRDGVFLRSSSLRAHVPVILAGAVGFGLADVVIQLLVSDFRVVGRLMDPAERTEVVLHLLMPFVAGLGLSVGVALYRRVHALTSFRWALRLGAAIATFALAQYAFIAAVRRAVAGVAHPNAVESIAVVIPSGVYRTSDVWRSHLSAALKQNVLFEHPSLLDSALVAVVLSVGITLGIYGALRRLERYRVFSPPPEANRE